MRVVALEEHFTAPALSGRSDRVTVQRCGYRPRRAPPSGPSPLELAPDPGQRRPRLMDESGIAVQVRSNTGPGPDLVPGAASVDLAKVSKNHLAEGTGRHPDRLAGFAVLPVCSPDAAPAELERTVKNLGFHISLPPADMAKLTHGNADALLKLKVPAAG